jgi:hypothetical protein
MKNAIVLALLLMRMFAEEIVKEDVSQEEGRIIGLLVVGNWYLAWPSPGSDNAKYQVPRAGFLIIA